MAENIDDVFRDWNVLGDPASGEYEPEKPRIRALLWQMQATSGQSVTRNTLAQLNAVTPPDENYGGIVLNDPDPANNGYYARVSGAWVRGRGFPDTFAEGVLSGSGSAQVASFDTGINPADIEVFWSRVATENTGPMTLNGKPVLSVAGNPLVAGEWSGIVLYVDEGPNWRLLIDVNAAQIASQAASDAVIDAGRAEDAADRAEAAASGVEFPVSYAPQLLTPEQQAQARENIGLTTFSTVSLLLSDTSLSYIGAHPVAPGDIVTAQGFRYEVAASAAVDEHVTTAGGVKLKVLPGDRGFNAHAFNCIPPDDWDAFDGGDKRGPNRLAEGSRIYDAVSAAWAAALDRGVDLYFPAGRYEISGQRNFPWRQPGTPTSLLDCGGISIVSDGPSTVFATNSNNGADVFNLNGLKNFSVRGYPTINAIIGDGNVAGSNGVSITNGFDGLYIEVECENLPHLDKGPYVDGGKGLTIQSGTTVNPCGSIKAVVRAKGCSYGFGSDFFLDTMKTKKQAVDIEVYAEDCYRSVVVGGVAGTGVEDIDLGLNIRGEAVNCQQDAVIVRGNGVRCNLNVITNKSAAARRLSPSGVAWISSDTRVAGMLVQSSRNIRAAVRGNKGECDVKADINNSTVASYFDIDLGGSATSNILMTGGTVNTCVFQISPRTAVIADVPSLMINPTYGNLFDFSGTLRAVSPIFADAVRFAFGADGVTESGRIDLFGSITGLQGKGTGTAGAVVAGLYDQAGTFRLGIRNGNGIVLDALGTASAVGAYVGKQPVYNSAGTLLGYFPIYN